MDEKALNIYFIYIYLFIDKAVFVWRLNKHVCGVGAEFRGGAAVISIQNEILLLLCYFTASLRYLGGPNYIFFNPQES